MKRAIIGFFLGGVLGVVAGFMLGIFTYPYIFLADVVAEERLEPTAGRVLVGTGTFIHANPADPIHYGSGTVSVYDDVVHLGDDFEVGPGPKYHLYLVPLADVTPDTEVDQTMYVDLGRLRAFKGSQVYPIPPGIELKQYDHVVVWCERFGVLISPAKLALK